MITKLLPQIALLSTFTFTFCQPIKDKDKVNSQISPQSTDSLVSKLNVEVSTIEFRFLVPFGFKRNTSNKNSYSSYLRDLPLKVHGSEVKLYNGLTKPNYNTYDAVIDLAIGLKDLHQCAYAIMRLKAEYLWKNKRYSEIHFNLTNGFLADFNKWKEGYKINVKNNQSHWYKAGAPSNTYQDFWKYMEYIFGYAGTLSFSKELRPIAIDSMQIGDVLIQRGSPGHVILVIDMCINPNTKEKLFLLA